MRNFHVEMKYIDIKLTNWCKEQLIGGKSWKLINMDTRRFAELELIIFNINNNSDESSIWDEEDQVPDYSPTYECKQNGSKLLLKR